MNVSLVNEEFVEIIEVVCPPPIQLNPNQLLCDGLAGRVPLRDAIELAEQCEEVCQSLQGIQDLKDGVQVPPQ
eukprot:1932878-Alexandrium_andersonii.AAC.1